MILLIIISPPKEKLNLNKKYSFHLTPTVYKYITENTEL